MRRVRQPSDSDGSGWGRPPGPPCSPLSREQALPVIFPGTKVGPPLISILHLYSSHWEGAFEKLSQGNFPPLKSQESPAKSCSGWGGCWGRQPGAVVSGARTGTTRHQRGRWHRGMSKLSSRLCPSPETWPLSPRWSRTREPSA